MELDVAYESLAGSPIRPSNQPCGLLSVPTPSENRDSYCCNNWWTLRCMSTSGVLLSLRALLSPQFSWILESQSRPTNAGPGVSSTCRVNSFSWPLNLTIHFISPLGVIFCPVLVLSVTRLFASLTWPKCSLYRLYGSTDTAEPVSSSILTTLPCTSGLTHMTWSLSITLLTSRDPK